MTELKPCPNPWCRDHMPEGCGLPKTRQIRLVKPFDLWNVRCGSCHIEGPTCPTEAAAILAWNTRPAPASRLADVRLGAEAAIAHFATLDWDQIDRGNYGDAARIAATVTLPDAEGVGVDKSAIVTLLQECKEHPIGTDYVTDRINEVLRLLNAPTPESKGTQGTDGVKWPEHKAGMQVTHNAHKDVYETVEDYTRENEAWVSPEEKQKAIQSNELWELQWYPETPVGFSRVTASTLEACLQAALASKESDRG